MHWIPEADHILNFDEGRIIQQGTFEELAAVPGFIQDLGLSKQNPASSEAKEEDKEVVEVHEAPLSEPELNAARTDGETTASASAAETSARQTGDFRTYAYYFSSVPLWDCVFFFGTMGVNVALVLFSSSSHH